MSTKGRILWEEYKKGSQTGTSYSHDQTRKKSVTPTVQTKGREQWEAFKNSGGMEEFEERISKERSGSDQRKSVQTASQSGAPSHAPFASEQAWKDYYQSIQEKGKPTLLPKAGESLPVRNSAQQEQQGVQQEDQSFWERFVENYRKFSGGTMGMGEYAGIAAASANLATDDSYKKPTADWSEKDLEVYQAIADPKKAERFAIDINNSINKKKRDQELQKAEDFGKEHKAAAWAGNTASGILSLGSADFLANGIEHIARGEVTEKEYATPRQILETASAGASADLNQKYGTISEEVPVLGGKGWGEAYQLTQSIAQSMALANMTGQLGKAGAYATDVVFFGNSAASAFDDAKQRGATDAEAYLYGAANGLNEALGEHLSIENLITMKNPYTLVQLGKSILTQAGIEGSEELLTSFLNNWADNFIMKDKSNFNTWVEEYTANGMSEAESKKKAWARMANDMAFDFVGGAFSGGISGGLQSGKNYITSNIYGKQYRGSQQELVQEALDINPDNAVAKRAQEKYIENGKNVPANMLSQMVEMNESAILEDAVRQRLEELGETGDIEKITRTITEGSEEGELGLSGKRLLKNSRFGQQVFSEVLDGSIFDNTSVAEETEARQESSPVSHETDYGDARDQYPMNKERAEQEHAMQTGMPVTEQTQQAEKEEQKEAPAAPAQVQNGMDSPVDAPEKGVGISEVSKKYGDQAKAVERVYAMGDQNVAPDAFGEAFGLAYKIGAEGMPMEEAAQKRGILTQAQAELAYKIGADANGAYQSGESGQAHMRESREPVNIESVESLENGTLRLRLDSGETVDAKEVLFGTYGEARIYKAVSSMDIDADTANHILSRKDRSDLSETAFASAILEAYQLGSRGVEFGKIRSNSLASRLSSGRASCTMHISASIRRPALRLKPDTVSCTVCIIRTSSPVDSLFASSAVSESGATPESMATPLAGAVLRISRSRSRLSSSSSRAPRSLPWL